MSSLYRKALRCTFFGKRKNLCSSKLVQLLLLNRVKARWSKNSAAQGFYYINSFSPNIFEPYSKTCPCKVRAAWGRVSRGLTVRHNQSMKKLCLSIEMSILFRKSEVWTWSCLLFCILKKVTITGSISLLFFNFFFITADF